MRILLTTEPALCYMILDTSTLKSILNTGIHHLISGQKETLGRTAARKQ
jgi:hypothetical protein